MAKAKTRIKYGEPKKRAVDDKTDKSHLKSAMPGEEVPADVAKGLPDSAVDRGGARGAPKRLIDAEDNDSYGGAEAARESLMMRPDNPNRPAHIDGEDSWKVAGGALGTAASTGTEERTQVSTTKLTDEQKAQEKAQQSEVDAEAKRMTEERKARGEQ